MSENKLKYRWLSKFLPKINHKRIVAITGARQTGKTTLAKLFYPELKYINLDAPENRDSIRSVATANWSKDVGQAVIDEAQKEPTLFEKVKFAYDAGSLDFSVLLGSAQIMLLSQIRESLSGRVFLYELWPLMLSELLTPYDQGDIPLPILEEILNTNKMDDLLASKPTVLFDQEEALRKNAENYLIKYGGMPELLHLDDTEKVKWLTSYEYTYLEKDLSDLARLRDLEPFRKFQKLSALRSGKLLNYSELAKDAGISVDSARRYLEYLKLSYQAILLQPFYENLTSSLVKTPKLYFLDIGILRQMSGFMGEINGETFETYVVSEIFKWIKTSQKRVEIYFYRTRSGLELDLILQTENGFLGLEIKTSAKITKVDFSPMLTIAKKLKDRWLGGICVYRGNKIEKLAEPSIWAVPSHRLFSS